MTGMIPLIHVPERSILDIIKKVADRIFGLVDVKWFRSWSDVFLYGITDS